MYPFHSIGTLWWSSKKPYLDGSNTYQAKSFCSIRKTVTFFIKYISNYLLPPPNYQRVYELDFLQFLYSSLYPAFLLINLYKYIFFSFGPNLRSHSLFFRTNLKFWSSLQQLHHNHFKQNSFSPLYQTAILNIWIILTILWLNITYCSYREC